MTPPWKTSDDPGTAVRAPPIRPPVHDSAVQTVLPAFLRSPSRASASKWGVVPASGDVLEPTDPVYVVHDLRDRLGHQRPPFLAGDDPAADLRPGIDLAVVQGRGADLESGLLEQTPRERVVGVDPPERRGHGDHVGDPYRIAVQILHRDDAVVGDARIGQRVIYHQVPLTGREGVLRMMGILGATDSDDQVVRLRCAFADDVHMSVVERLEPSHDHRVRMVVVPRHGRVYCYAL